MNKQNLGNTGRWILTSLALVQLTACQDQTSTVQDVVLALQRESVASTTQKVARSEQAQFNPRLLRRFKPSRESLREDGTAFNQREIDLGRKLFFETRLSKNNTLSCNSCHRLDRHGVDGEATSRGHDGQRGTRNSPTVYHAAGYFAQFWDGRAATIEEQAIGPLTNPLEMGLADTEELERILRAIPQYRVDFAAAFPGEAHPVTATNVGRALGAFQRGLVTRSRWDAFLEGDRSALSAQEMEGLRVFTNVGCMVCHTGEFLGGSMFAKVGVVEDWENQNDQGRYEVTHSESDRMMFKVPTLRNVAKTAPYFHDASAATLDQAVDMMGKHQLGVELTSGERDAIVAWLNALTGELPSDYIAPPHQPVETSQQIPNVLAQATGTPG